MRNQIKKMMKKENGFTLVELLAVLAILAIIVAIAIPAVGSIIDNADTQATEAEKSLVIDAARLYVLDEDYESGDIDVQTLIDEGYLEDRGEGSTPSGTVTVTEEGNGKYTFSYDTE